MDPIAHYRAGAPYVFFLLALMLGIVLASWVHPSQYLYILVWVVKIVFSIFFIGLTVANIKYKRTNLFSLAGCSFLFITGFWGWTSTWKDYPSIDKLHFSRTAADYLIGYLSDEPKMKGTAMTVEFTVTAVKDQKGDYKKAHGRLLLDIRNEQLDTSLVYGDELVLTNKYQKIKPPFNPHEFNYARYMANHNCWHRSYHTLGNYAKTGNKGGTVWIAIALSVRKRMIGKFGRYFKNKEALAMMSTLVLGSRATLDKELIKAFSATGTIHVLAVSGMHVAIVFAFLSFGLQWMGRNPVLKFIRLIVFLVFIWCYTFLTGFSASVLRAALMISFFIIGNNFLRDRNTVNSIAASAFFLLLFNPKYLMDVGFQLSYLAVMGIIWLTPMMMQAVNLSNTIVKKGFNYMALSCGAQLTTSPLVLYYFHAFPVYFLPANLFITIPATLMIYVGFLLLVLPTNELSLWIASLLEKMIIVVNKGLITIETWPSSTIKGIWLKPWEYLLLYLLLLLSVYTFRCFYKSLFYALLICLMGMGLWLNIRIWNRSATKQLLVFNVSNQMAIALLEGDKPIVYSDATSMNASFLQHAVVPTIEALSDLGNISFIPMPAKVHYGSTQINDKLLCFIGKQFWIIDGKEEMILPDISPHWMLIRNNPSINPSVWQKALEQRALLIVDGSNNYYTIQKLNHQAAELGLDVYHLKDNFAYVWDAKKQR